MVELGRFFSEGKHLERLAPILHRLQCKLDANADLPQAWEALTVDFFDRPLPNGISSCLAFALRAGSIFGSERHPNSWQRSIGIHGSAHFELYLDGEWQARPVAASGPGAGNSVSIPPNVWHRIGIGPGTFVSLSFHTAPESELIEETSLNDNFSETTIRLYSDR